MNQRRSVRNPAANWLARAGTAVAALALTASAALAQQPQQLNTGKIITPPTGPSAGVGSLPMNVILSPDGKYAVTSDMGFHEFVTSIDTSTGNAVSQVDFNSVAPNGRLEGLYYGLVFGPNGRLYAAQGATNTIAILTLGADGTLTNTGQTLNGQSVTVPGLPIPGIDTPAGLALDGRGYLYVANTDPELPVLPSSVAVYDTATNLEVGRYSFPTSTFGPTNYPYSVAALADGSKIYVGSQRDASVYVLSANFAPIGASATNPTLVGSIPTGLHPVALLLNKAQTRLYVANAHSDTVSVIDTTNPSPTVNPVIATIPVRPVAAGKLPGATPTNLALSPDESTLYVTLGDMNAVAVVNLAQGRTVGYIPTGWYPTGVAVTPDGKHLLIANAKGTVAKYPNPLYGTVLANSNGDPYYDLNLIQGNVSTIPVPTPGQLLVDSIKVFANNKLYNLHQPNPLANIGFQAPHGIRHIVYIVKENRTYDQVLGDLVDSYGHPRGNGDPSLALFNKPITPNLHRLANRFVLLDNYYEGGEASGDGWNWSTQGLANEYNIKNLPYNYSGRSTGIQYDFQGQNNGYIVGGFPATDVDGMVLSPGLAPGGLPPIPDISQGPGGYIWDDVKSGGLTYRNYGVNLSTGLPGVIPDNFPTQTNIQPEGHDLAGISDYDFRRFDLDFPDSDAPSYYYAQTGDPNCLFPETQYGKYNAPSRFSEFKREFGEMLAADATGAKVPQFMIMTLMSDHTQGSTPGAHTPESMVADNDYGVGQMVDLISHSAIWKDTAIFVIEDDAQDGPDHVDCHRSFCYVISPWINKTVDHHFYNTDSVLKTMELLMGLPPMNQYDAVADPILDWYYGPVNSAPYSAVLPAKSIIAQINPPLSSLKPKSLQYKLAVQSSKMDFKHADDAPAGLLNTIIWKSVKGWNSPPPAPRHKVIAAGKATVKTARDND